MSAYSAKKLTGILRSSIHEVVQEFKQEVADELGSKFHHLLLFGSHARGEAMSESDIDLLLLVTRLLSHDEEEKIDTLCDVYSLRYNTVITCFVYLQDDFDRKNSPFLQNVRRESLLT